MSSGRLILLTWPNGYFGSTLQAWEFLDTAKMAADLQSTLQLQVMVIPVNEILNFHLSENDVIVYTSSENKFLRDYIKDHIYMVSQKARVVPSFDHLMAHENKGFQQIYRNDRKIGRLEGQYLVTRSDINAVHPPYVFKSVDGAGSSGVWLVKSKKDTVKASRFFQETAVRLAINFARQLKLNPEQFLWYKYARQNFRGAVVQKFVEGLSCDYKILIFGNKLYGIKRQVRKGDFRASGSGLLEFNTAPDAVLDFAWDVFSQLKAPYASLDLALGSSGCHLIEYQVLNFGPSGLVNSSGFFEKKGDAWRFIKEEPNLENAFCHAISWFLKGKQECL